ncbi:MAG: hypothetical protein NZM25_03970 [Leptospiraceae bacterium]|nr:hypothetical protein [Leptospiraceae bacterium]MDW8306143.1 hypothetical protein [Leptospiraceae bacterium]
MIKKVIKMGHLKWAIFSSLALGIILSCRHEILLTNPYPSLKELSAALLEAAQENSLEKWQKLLISREEFREHIYPYLPEAKGPGKVSEEDYWEWVSIDTDKARKKLFALLKGREIISFEVKNPTKVLRQGRYKILRDIPLVVRLKTESGEESLESREILKAVIEARGGYKLWNSLFEG